MGGLTMTTLNLTYVQGDTNVDPQWTHPLDRGCEIVIQDARAYGGNLVINIWDPEDDGGSMWHFGEEVTMASAHETAARVLALYEEFKGDIAQASATFHGVG